MNPAYIWSKEAEAVLHKLKEIFTSVAELLFPDLDWPFVQETDTSEDWEPCCLRETQKES